MEDCIFCKIVKGELPSYKIYEDEKHLVFLDIYPKTRGHALVIPKKHYQWVYDLPENEFAEYWKIAHKISKAQQKALNPTFISYLTYGLDVPHAHIHVIPYYRPVSPQEAVNSSEKLSKEDLTEIAEKIREKIKNS